MRDTLQNTQQLTGRQQAPSGLATADQAAIFLGLSRSMVFKLIGEGKIPVCRYGRAVRISWTWLRNQAGEQ